MSDEVRLKKDGTPDPRYGPRKNTGVDSLGQQVIPGTVVDNPIVYVESAVSTNPALANVPGDSSMLSAPFIPPVPRDAENLRVIHFMEDGFTALGKSWYRGEEFRVIEGSPTWEETLDRTGFSWVNLSEDDQYEKYGKLFFREGPWRGKGYDSAEFPDGAEYSAEDLKKLEKRRQREQGAPMKPARA